MRVLFATADLAGPQGHYRAHLPAAALRRAGHDAVVVGAIAADDHGRLRAFDRNRAPRVADVVVLQGWYHPDAPRVIEQARRAGQRVVCDVDDNVWSIPDDNPAAAAAGEWRPTLEAIVAACDAVFVSTPALVAPVERVGAAAVAICPNGVDTGAVRPPASARDNFTGPGAQPPPVVAWLGRTTFRGGDLSVLAGQLRPFLERGRCRFRHFGHVEGDPPVTDILGTDAGMLAPAPWCYIEELWAKLRADVVIVPQVPCEFAFSRSAATGLLAGALAIPVMATITPAYRELADVGGLAWAVWENGGGWASGFDYLLAREPIGWARRQRAGREARGAVVRGWDSDVVGRSWSDALRRVRRLGATG